MLNLNMIIREWLNGSLVPLTTNLTLIIGVYIVQCFTDAKRSGTSWHSVPGIKTAIALFWIFLAVSIRASFTWIELRAMNSEGELTPTLAHVSSAMLVLGTAVLTAAVLRCTYIFTPKVARNIFWVYSLVVTALFLVVTHAFPDFPYIN